MSDSLHQRFIELDAQRGTIYSEDGQMLSTSIPTFDIYIDFNAEGLREKKGKRFTENVDSFSIALANYFGDKTALQYKNELKQAFKKNARYYSLKKKLSFEQYKAFREFPLPGWDVIRVVSSSRPTVKDYHLLAYWPAELLVCLVNIWPLTERSKNKM